VFDFTVGGGRFVAVVQRGAGVWSGVCGTGRVGGDFGGVAGTELAGSIGQNLFGAAMRRK
jgi:hypothetical protein